MLKISNIKIPARYGSDKITYFASKMTGLPESLLKLNKILKLSIDSRRKPEVYKIYSAAFECKNEGAVLARKIKNVSLYSEQQYQFPYSEIKSDLRPVIVGFGPAGIMAALVLTEAGFKPIVIERGYDADSRTKDVETFFSTGILNTSSNVQYGEGGAGMFSDGKLTTGINDKRISFVFSQFVRFGAPEDILYLAKPHIGTDKLKEMIKNIRNYLISLGCDIRFGHKLIGFNCSKGAVKSVAVESEGSTYNIDTDAVILAIGNSARDTFRLVEKSGIKMEPKSFAVGVRIEHLQKDIDVAQYGEAATLGTLPASDYKLAVHLEDGRGVFTFCVCPGGYVVAAASENGGVVTNGMSYYARNNENINGGLLVSVTPEDFKNELFGGMEFQRDLEHRAFLAGGSDYSAPAQLVGDFLNKVPTKNVGTVIPSYKPKITFCNLWDVLPEFICTSLAKAITEMDNKIKGFSNENAVLTAVETRSSSPVRILRDSDGMSSLKGIFPCGEGAGYAGGITSASVDGIKSAELLCSYLTNTLKFNP